MGLLVSIWGTTFVQSTDPLPGTLPLTLSGDLAALMVNGIDRHLDDALLETVSRRQREWQTRMALPHSASGMERPVGELHSKSWRSAATTHCLRLAQLLGVVDTREPVEMRFVAPVGTAANFKELGRGAGYRIYVVSWNVFRGVSGEGLLLQPDAVPKADVIALPDCQVRPEQLVGLESGLPEQRQFARRLVENGCRVLVPALVNRGCVYDGYLRAGQGKHSLRETLWRASYEMGRTPAGYEVQMVLAAADWMTATRQGPTEPSDLPEWLELQAQAPAGLQSLGIMGHGEGGRIAFYAAALDPRFRAAAVSGYFAPRERLHQEPIDRNVWSLLAEFGDAEVSQLILPRPLLIEHGHYPEATFTDKYGGAPGQLWTPSLAEVAAEVDRAKSMAGPRAPIHLIQAPGEVGSPHTIQLFLDQLIPGFGQRSEPADPPQLVASLPAPRQRRLYLQILEDTQWLMRESEYTRREFWKKADFTDAKRFEKSAQWYRDYCRSNLVGMLPPPSLPANPRTRFLYETNGYQGYEVVLDVYPNVFAYGILLLPTSIQPGEKRPVVVCQHGLEGRPRDVADPRVHNPAYNKFACRLAERGFITFAPQNPYIGRTGFRQLLRKSQPLGLTLYSFILRQHEVLTSWLASLQSVNPEAIALYGLSYGGKTAMRIPPLLDRYCLSICSADFNEWIWKNVSARAPYTYLWTVEYDMPEFDMGNTFNYAELSWLIFPRPFMVERGHWDGVAPSEWVAYEYTRTRRHYDLMGLGDRTAIEFFNGPHQINGQGTFEFLHRHLRRDKP